MEFFVTSPDIRNKTSILQLFERLREIAKDRVGYCYYKYPLAGGIDNYLPSITILDKEYGICTLDSYEWTIDEITEITSDVWRIGGEEVDSPLLRLEDYRFSLLPRYEKYRELRGDKIQFASHVILPAIPRTEFVGRFPSVSAENILFSDYLTTDYRSFWPEARPLEDADWDILVSVSQGANTLSDYKPSAMKVSHARMREAIDTLRTRLALLDNDQHAAAIQIPDGPQRIRGLAGTGKTVILAMKAAFYHQRHPDHKVLYTFNTQSLYTQIRRLITRFYRQTEDHDPNWDNLQVLHAWGGATKDGVYHRTCLRNGVAPAIYSSVKHYGSTAFDMICKGLLEAELSEDFDFMLMDEAQDFPASFYQLIYRIAKQPKRIIWAYDELQSLTDLQIQDTGVFGYDKHSNRLVDFSAGSYDNGIEMDFVLKKSYRNPLEVQMVAHGIGLGIHNEAGPLQMIDNKDVWASIGYQILEGDLRRGQKTVISRPPENNPSPIRQCYAGRQPFILCKGFPNRKEEIAWIAESIRSDIHEEGVRPQEIVVISLNPTRARENFMPLQMTLFGMNIPSIAPGFTEDRDRFAEDGYVTLSTVFRAKGNEAPLVYVMNADHLYDYVEEIRVRNMAFSSITRTKGWCRITGVGEPMDRAILEIQSIQRDIPNFAFKFPDMNKIRRLSTEEYARRSFEQKKTNQLINQLLQRDDEILQNVSEEQKQALRAKLGL